MLCYVRKEPKEEPKGPNRPPNLFKHIYNSGDWGHGPGESSQEPHEEFIESEKYQIDPIILRRPNGRDGYHHYVCVARWIYDIHLQEWRWKHDGSHEAHEHMKKYGIGENRKEIVI